MASNLKFTVRPFTSPKNDPNDSFRVHLSALALSKLKAHPGDILRMQVDGGSPQMAIAWLSPEPKLTDGIVQTSKVLQQTYGLSLQDKVTVVKARQPQSAEEIVVKEVHGQTSNWSNAERGYWDTVLPYQLSQIRHIAVSMEFNVDMIGRRTRFSIVAVDGAHDDSAFTFTPSTRLKLGLDPGVLNASWQIDGSGVGALEYQLATIQKVVNDIGQGRGRDVNQYFPSLQPNHGILLYGPKGTGKSLVLRKIGSCQWSRKFTTILKDAQTVAKVFAEAIATQPSLVLIDQLESIAPQQSAPVNATPPNEVVAALVASFEQVQNTRVLVVATARHPNMVAETLRIRGRFGTEIELPVPTADGRLQILKAVRGAGTLPSDSLLSTIAERTHAYVGADLYQVYATIAEKALARLSLAESPIVDSMAAMRLEADGSEAPTYGPQTPKISEADVAEALKEVRPTAMQEIFIETPNVHWADIGGQHAIKELLQGAVDISLKSATYMKSWNLERKKGIMLYGPPGCSKTLLVKALATEAGLNFLAVKGAEILSMYVGESERAVRDVFRKARSASPSILFFDEIDAIASERGGPQSHGGLNVLTTLLNEMDGFEDIKNVLVVAATNKPEAIDKALMRPGRFDKVLYVGPPDLEARTEMIESWLQKSRRSPSIQVDTLAARTDGFSGAEIVNICQTAGEHAMKEHESGTCEAIEHRHFDMVLASAKRGITQDVIDRYERWCEL